MYSIVLYIRVSLILYLSRCNMTSSEVKQRYLVGGEEAEESTNIMFVPMATISDLHMNSELWHDLTPSAKGCITMYHLSQSSI